MAWQDDPKTEETSELGTPFDFMTGLSTEERRARVKAWKNMCGMFFAFEGMEGVGKTAVIEGVRKALTMANISVTVLRQGNGPANALRNFRLCNEIPPIAYYHVLMAENFLLWQQAVEAMGKEHVVLADRWTTTLLAYQEAGHGVRRCSHLEYLPDAHTTLVFHASEETIRERHKLRNEAQPQEYEWRTKAKAFLEGLGEVNGKDGLPVLRRIDANPPYDSVLRHVFEVMEHAAKRWNQSPLTLRRESHHRGMDEPRWKSPKGFARKRNDSGGQNDIG